MRINLGAVSVMNRNINGTLSNMSWGTATFTATSPADQPIQIQCYTGIIGKILHLFKQTVYLDVQDPVTSQPSRVAVSASEVQRIFNNPRYYLREGSGQYFANTIKQLVDTAIDSKRPFPHQTRANTTVTPDDTGEGDPLNIQIQHVHAYFYNRPEDTTRAFYAIGDYTNVRILFKEGDREAETPVTIVAISTPADILPEAYQKGILTKLLQAVMEYNYITTGQKYLSYELSNPPIQPPTKLNEYAEFNRQIEATPLFGNLTRNARTSIFQE